MPDNSRDPYRLVWTGQQLKQLKIWSKQAAALGITASYLAALKAINLSLTTEPSKRGDPCYRLNQLGLLLYHAIWPPLYIMYGVDENRRIVFVKQITPLPRCGLEPGE